MSEYHPLASSPRLLPISPRHHTQEEEEEEVDGNILVVHETLEAAFGLAVLEVRNDEALLYVEVVAEDFEHVGERQRVLGYWRRVEGKHGSAGDCGGGGSASALFLIAVVVVTAVTVAVAVVVLGGGGGAATGGAVVAVARRVVASGRARAGAGARAVGVSRAAVGGAGASAVVLGVHCGR